MLTELGSGVTLYVSQAGPNGVFVNISVDGNSSTTKILDPPPPPDFYQSNVSIFDIQSLPSTSHTINLRVLSYFLMFDYAAVNTTIVSPIPSSSSSSESSTTSPSSSISSSTSSSSATSSSSPPTILSSSQGPQYVLSSTMRCRAVLIWVKYNTARSALKLGVDLQA